MTLENLWAGWRNEYVTSATEAERSGDGAGPDGCVFCRIARSGEPSEENLIVWRDELTFAVLNAYPYASGHLLVMPLRHVSKIEEMTSEERADMWRGTEMSIGAITAAYDPDGLNMGANLGRAAGAGIPKHLHVHALPRWSGDTNFMTAVASVRVMPESLVESWRKLRAAWPPG